MKKNYLLLVLYSCCFSVFSQNVSIPDANFKTRVLAVADTNNDGEIQQNEAAVLTSLNVNTSINDSNGDITSLEGIQYFTALQSLSCNGNSITNLDVSMLSSLEILICRYNELGILNIVGLSNLEEVYCTHNNLSSLDTSGLTNLKILSCDVNNLGSLNIQNMPALLSLTISSNELTNLDVSQMPVLQRVLAYDNQLTSITTTNAVSLKELDISSNLFTSINITGINSLMSLTADNNEISDITISEGINLEYLSINNTSITSITLDSYPSLKALHANDCQLITIDCSQTQIEELFCSNNPDLTSINVQNGVISSSDPDMLYFAFQVDNLPSLTSICFDNGEQINLGGTGFDPEGNVTLYTGENCDVEIFLGLDNHEMLQLAVYPNPFIDRITLNYENAPESIEVIDINGRIINQPIFSNNGISTDIDLTGITQTGIYIMKAIYPDKILSTKIIKK